MVVKAAVEQGLLLGTGGLEILSIRGKRNNLVLRFKLWVDTDLFLGKILSTRGGLVGILVADLAVFVSSWRALTTCSIISGGGA